MWSNTTWPFPEDPIHEEAALLCRELHIHGRIILRPRRAVLSFYFSWQSLSYLHNPMRPHMHSITSRARAPPSVQSLCVALRVIANWRGFFFSFFLYISDAEHISKATVCRAVRHIMCHFTDEGAISEHPQQPNNDKLFTFTFSDPRLCLLLSAREVIM